MAKTHKNLYGEVASFSALYFAWRKAQRGKRYRVTTATFSQNLDTELLALHRELSDETYSPGEYQHFYVHDPKRRLMSAAPCFTRMGA